MGMDLAKKALGAGRSLTNPDIRLPLRADFPSVIPPGAVLTLLKVLEEELEKIGRTLENCGPLTMAYPQKNPLLFPDHANAGPAAADWCRKAFDEAAQKRFPQVTLDWQKAEGLCEDVHLDRSTNQTSLHALTGRQMFNVMAGKPVAIEGGLFVLADWCVDQGTTMANMISYIHHNGGHVLMVAAGEKLLGMVPKDHKIRYKHGCSGAVETGPEFSAARSAEGLRDIAYLMAKSANRDGRLKLTPQRALEHVERAINTRGHSLKSLTDGEAKKLTQSLADGSVSYRQLIDADADRTANIMGQVAAGLLAGVQVRGKDRHWSLG